MYRVGKISRAIYGCVSTDIKTNEVIITNRQMMHIKERHPEACEQLMEHIKDALEEPDYILADKHENTALVVKRLKIGKTWGQVVLRLCTSTDEPSYKNSVISYWEISDKRLQSYLRNKKVLYKKEYSE